MRSRYTAFAVGAMDHLLATWHPDRRPERIDPEPELRWIGLDVRAVHAGGPEDLVGTVEFVARYKIAGRAHRLHELSQFARVEGAWTYVDGIRADETRRDRT
jgi:SEC-C motif-containing protein